MIIDDTNRETTVSEKRARFIRIAEARTSRAMKAIRLIRNLSNTYIYEYRAEEIDAIVASLENEIASLKHSLQSKINKNNVFTLASNGSRAV
jgi:hypothetical protein